MKRMQPAALLGRYMGVTQYTMRSEEENAMDFIKRLIIAAIESFPIQKEKKEALLKCIVQNQTRGGDGDVLR